MRRTRGDRPSLCARLQQVPRPASDGGCVRKQLRERTHQEQQLPAHLLELHALCEQEPLSGDAGESEQNKQLYYKRLCSTGSSV